MHTQLLSTVPSLGDFFENITLLGLGLLIFIAAIALCGIFVDNISKAFEAAADRTEAGVVRRQRRRGTPSRKYKHLRVVNGNAAPVELPNAFRALARSAHHAEQHPVSPSFPKRFPQPVEKN